MLVLSEAVLVIVLEETPIFDQRRTRRGAEGQRVPKRSKFRYRTIYLVDDCWSGVVNLFRVLPGPLREPARRVPSAEHPS